MLLSVTRPGADLPVQETQLVACQVCGDVPKIPVENPFLVFIDNIGRLDLYVKWARRYSGSLDALAELRLHEPFERWLRKVEKRAAKHDVDFFSLYTEPLFYM